MHRSMISNPAGQSSRISIITQDRRIGNCQTGIPITQEAIVSQVLVRGASSSISLTQRAPGIWSLAATSTINLTDAGDRLRVVFGDGISPLTLVDDVDIAGGRIYIPDLVVARSNAGLIITRSDACLVVILDRP